MTRLKIEVVGDDDAAALRVMNMLFCHMSDIDERGRVIINDAHGIVSYAFGTATATVERGEDAKTKCECCNAAITRNDRTDGCPKCWRMRCVHCDAFGRSCRVCEMGDGKGAT